MTAAHVRSLREHLLRALRRPNESDNVQLSDAVLHWISGFSAAELRVGLAWLAALSAGSGISSTDVQLWIDTSALRGIRVPVRTCAIRLGVSSRQAHRRIQAVDDVVAARLRITNRAEFAGLARPIGLPLPTKELVELARADSHLTSAPSRALDALAMYLRNRTGGRAPAREPRYQEDNKDTRYRDASRVAIWLTTLAHDPPLPPTTTEDERQLTVATGIRLAVEPAEALAHVSAAIIAQRRDVLPLLLAHAANLISSPSSAGIDAWLGLLQLRYHAAMESEHIVGLRYARALAADAARLSTRGIRDPQVRRGLSGCGHVLQMFGHYDAALTCYARAARHVAHFPGSSDDEEQVAHDIHAQITYIEALRGGRKTVADKALQRMHAIADRHGDVVEIQYTRYRRALEVRLGFMVRRDDLLIAPSTRRSQSALEEEFQRFLTLSSQHPSANRGLSSHDITLLYAVLTRDANLAASARAGFQRLTNSNGGYANLSHRFNSRLRAAATLSPRFVDIEQVTEPPDPLRVPAASPQHATGLLVSPTRHA